MRQKLRGTFGVLRPNTLKFVRSVSFVRRAATLGGGGVTRCRQELTPKFLEWQRHLESVELIVDEGKWKPDAPTAWKDSSVVCHITSAAAVGMKTIKLSNADTEPILH